MRTNDARMVHKLVKETAMELAGAFYEVTAGKSNEFYAAFPNQKMFIRKEWQKFVMVARNVLGHMLGLQSTPEGQKQQIYDALINDMKLPYSPKETQIINFN